MSRDTNDLFELMSKMYAEMNSKFDAINSKFTEMSSKFDNLSSDVKGIRQDVSKNSVTLEKLDSNVKLLAEGQEAFREQLGRNDSADKHTINERLELIEQAVTYTSKSLDNFKSTIDVVKDTTANNNLDIKILKRLTDKNL